MATLDYRTTCELNKPVKIKRIDGLFFSQDVQANRIVVSVVRNGVNESITGTISANIIRADGETVVQAGEIDGNIASVKMPAAAYAVPGAIAIFVKLIQNGATSTIAAVTGYVYKSTTDVIVDPGTILPSIQDLLDSIDEATANFEDTVAGLTEDIDEAIARIPQDYQDLEDDVSSLKNAIDDMGNPPKLMNSEEENVDLDIADPNGNVLVRFKDGDFQVKNFSSKKIIQTTGEITDENADLYIADSVGNGIMRLHNGQIQTKGFSSDHSEYKKTFTYTNTSGTETVTRFFPKGTKIVCHLVSSASIGSDSIANTKVAYSYKDRSNQSHSIGSEYGYNFLKYILPEDAVSVTVSYGTGLLWGSSGTLAFSVFTEATFTANPVVVKLDTNGGGDFTSLRTAVETIAPYASEQTPYEIHVYPGTYNVYDDYTDAEIATSGFYGLMISNGISLIGIGSREEIVIAGEISTETYDETKRNDISTLNANGTMKLENLTITAKNIRYAIHDDFVTMTHRYVDHVYKNLKLKCTTMTTGDIAFGAGCGNGKRIHVIDCDVEGTFLLHNSANNDHNCHVYLDNCSASKFAFNDYDAVTPTYIHLRNCKSAFLGISKTGTHSQSMFIEGVGTCGCIINSPSGYVYDTGDCRRVKNVQISARYAVKPARWGYHSSYPYIAVCTDRELISGISVGIYGTDTIVQTSGYMNSNVLGLSGLSVGDYLTINSSGQVVSGGTSANAVAKVVFVDENSIAYAKLMI